MIRRFCLYGFLKNQRYFEPFLILAFLDKGLGFATIGLLVAVREGTTRLLEIPSGALADLWGRRRSMVLSFAAYVTSFLLLGAADRWLWLAAGMVLFGIGDAFRTGTHKAMILTWLEREGRLSEKTAVYGQTRSWSKLGSAASIPISMAVVWISGDYQAVFFVSVIPALADLVNLALYPAFLEGPAQGADFGAVWRHMRAALLAALQLHPLRRLVAESMGYEGYVKVAKDYLQPVVKAVALAAGLGMILPTGLDEPARVALLAGPLYFLVHILSAAASRGAGWYSNWAGGDEAAARRLWSGLALLSALLLLASLAGWAALFILALAAVIVLQNLWRPLLVSRFHQVAASDQVATVLSIESQAKSLSGMVLAPLVGLAVELAGNGTIRFWPVAALGLLLGIGFRATARRDAAQG